MHEAAPSSPRPATDGDVPPPVLAAWRAAGEWHHALFTGLILSTVVRCGAPTAESLVYRVFATQREARFLEGLRKLGLDRLPHAVAAAQYHYLSNAIGGVSVQYMPESDRKAWVRYVPPRWVWAGTALCGVPSQVSAAMLRGWHAQNGVTLGNPRLGFVCTKQTVDGDPALEGYYLEYDRALAPDERLRFARDEDGPDFDAALAPRLPAASWPVARREKARRNYAFTYVRTSLPIVESLLGEAHAASFLGLTGRLVGMQHFHAIESMREGAPAASPDALAPELAQAGDPRASAERYARFVAALAQAQDDAVAWSSTADGVTIEQRGWSAFAGERMSRPVFETLHGLYAGALAAADHRLALHLEACELGVVPRFAWRVRPRVRRER